MSNPRRERMLVLGLILLYLASTLYHSFTNMRLNAHRKQQLQ